VSLSSYRNYSNGFVTRAHPMSSSNFASNAINRNTTGFARPSYSSGAASPGWQRFGGVTAQQRYPSYARQYGAYQQPQRQYGAYQQPQRQYGAYQQPQRRYGSYQQPQRQYQSYGAPRQSYQGQRQYGSPQQRTQYYRPQQNSRSAPSHTSNSGGHPRGPGRP